MHTLRVVATEGSGISGVVLVTLLSPSRSKTEVFFATNLVTGVVFFDGSLTDGGITFRLSSSTCSTHSGSSAALNDSVLDTFSFFGGEGPDVTLATETENVNTETVLGRKSLEFSFSMYLILL